MTRLQVELDLLLAEHERLSSDKATLAAAQERLESSLEHLAVSERQDAQNILEREQDHMRALSAGLATLEDCLGNAIKLYRQCAVAVEAGAKNIIVQG